MEVAYIQHAGTDLTVVNAARVSFDAQSEPEFWSLLNEEDHPSWENGTSIPVLTERDIKLIKYLAKHKHWTPFSHCHVTLRIKAPIFVARQMFKHKVGFTENEISRRYVDADPEFHFPKMWRQRAMNAKQGSTELPVVDEGLVNEQYEHLIQSAEECYQNLLSAGVCPEQARMCLPQSMNTEWYLTGSLAAWARLYAQRSDSHAQKEIQDLAHDISKLLEPLFPYSWKELVSGSV